MKCIFIILAFTVLFGCLNLVQAVPTKVDEKGVLSSSSLIDVDNVYPSCIALKCTNGKAVDPVDFYQGFCTPNLPEEHHFHLNFILRTEPNTVSSNYKEKLKWQIQEMREVDECFCDLGSGSQKRKVYLPHYSQLVREKNSRVNLYNDKVVADLSYQRDIYSEPDFPKTLPPPQKYPYSTQILAHIPQDMSVEVANGWEVIDKPLADNLYEWYNHGFYMPLNWDQFTGLYDDLSSHLMYNGVKSANAAPLQVCVDGFYNHRKYPKADTSAQYKILPNNSYECRMRAKVSISGPRYADVKVTPLTLGNEYKANRVCQIERDNPLFFTKVINQAGSVLSSLPYRSVRDVVYRNLNLTGPYAGETPEDPHVIAQRNVARNWRQGYNENAINIPESARYNTHRFSQAYQKKV